MEEIMLIERKDLREELAGRVQVLDKVKKLFLLPKVDMVTSQQLAAYYELPVESINTCYRRNKEEVDQDGTFLRKLDFWNVHFEHSKTIPPARGSVAFQIDENTTLLVPNAGIRLFSKRAVLRIGMLLRDSEVAKEVRTQLLNTFEHTSDKQKVEDVEAEQEVLSQLALAYAAGDLNKFCQASMKYNAFKQRHIDRLTEDNKALTGEILHWTDRNSVNKAVRLIAYKTQNSFSYIWQKLYDELLYKHGILLRARGGAPYIRHVRENEWPAVQQTLCAICESNGISPSEIFARAKLNTQQLTVPVQSREDIGKP